MFTKVLAKKFFYEFHIISFTQCTVWLPFLLQNLQILQTRIDNFKPRWNDPSFSSVLVQLPYKRNLASRFSSASSSDVAPSLDESIDSGPLSDLQSDEDEGRRSADRRPRPAAAPPVDGRGGSTLVQQLLEDMKSQDEDPDTWKKIEVRSLLMNPKTVNIYVCIYIFT